jgi:sporulation protein YhbH
VLAVCFEAWSKGLEVGVGPSVSFSVNQQDWSLHRKGPVDQARHNEKVKEALKGNLAEIVAEQAIISADGDRVVKVPIRSLELPRFRFSRGEQTQAGQGSGDSQVGDVLGQEGSGPGRGQRAGNQPGIDYYEAELTVDDLVALVFQDLGLPFLKPKAKQQVLGETVRFDEIRKKGVMANLDKRRTLLENLRRNARDGRAEVRGLGNDDLRFKTWEPELREEQSAAIIAMRDCSGSMGEFEKYISRSFYLWMVRFLRTKYRNVEIVFITHHSEAKLVDEESFFHLGESGGTRVSSAYQLALNVITERFPADAWNVYPFHFSDGDNWDSGDNDRCQKLVAEMLARCNVFGYGEIRRDRHATSSTLMSSLSTIRDERFISVTISSKEDVYPALRHFFAGRDHESR